MRGLFTLYSKKAGCVPATEVRGVSRMLRRML